MSKEEELHNMIQSAERLGSIGSPSTATNLTIDILGTAVDKKLVGELTAFSFPQDGDDHYALGQITEVTLRNPWLEDPTTRSIVRQKGRLEAISGKQDTHTATTPLNSVFRVRGDEIEPSTLGTVPATGTTTFFVKDVLLNSILSPFREEIFYLGHVYGSKPLLPMWFKHFDSGKRGAGEAYHIGIFGKTGSGKSVLAKMILIAYARHKNMGLFILDPQGEFARGLRKVQMEFTLPMGDILCPQVLSILKRPYEVYDLHSLQLDRWEIFKELLIDFEFFERLGVKYSDYQKDAADLITDSLRGTDHCRLIDLHKQEVYEKVLNIISQRVQSIYAGREGQERIRQAASEAQDLNSALGRETFQQWQTAAKFFGQAPGLEAEKIVQKATRSQKDQTRPLIVVDLSRRPQEIPSNVWDEKIKPLLITRFVQALKWEGEKAYQEGRNLNTLVAIDEAHRLVPRSRPENERYERVRSELVDAARTTRKYGLGWMFLSQNISNLERDVIVSGLRTMFFGFGLGMGTELQALRELVGGEREYLRLYQSFKDPQSAFREEEKEFSFMAIGPVSPLSFSGAPLFFDAFTNSQKFLEENKPSLE